MSDPFGQPTPSKPPTSQSHYRRLRSHHHHSHRTSAVIGHETHVTYVSLVSRTPSPRPRAARPRGARLVSSAQRSHARCPRHARCPWAAPAACLRVLSCDGGGELCHKATRHHSRHDGALLMRPLVVAAGAPSARRLREWPLAAAAAAAADRSGPSSRAYCRAACSAVSKLPPYICLPFSAICILYLPPSRDTPL